jgi:putative membrane protein
MRTILLVAAAAAACAVTPVYAATDAECQAMWTKADVNKDGVLSDAEGMRYAAAMRVHDEKTKADGRINQASFLEACKADVYTPRPADAGAPLKGANSFTEGQAKDRALSHGLTDVGALKKDDDGIWRGSASQDGKPVEVAVDFKGNVVPQATR